MSAKCFLAVVFCYSPLVACGSGADPGIVPDSGGTGGAGAGGQPGQALAMLSLTEAPAATETLFWGQLDAQAPGFATLPQDMLTIGLGPDNGLRYMAWQTMPAQPKTYGDGPHDFPLTGSRQVDLSPDQTVVYDQVTVLDSPAPTATHFLLSSHYVSTGSQCDYVESIEGTAAGDGWAIVYSAQGILYAAHFSSSAQGTIYQRDPTATVAPAGQPSLWSAPVEMTAPGFTGPPVDHLTVSLDGSGQLRWFMFKNFVRTVSFTGNTNELPPGNAGTVADQGTVTYDDVVPATPAHFVIRYHAYSTEKLNDFVEGLDGTRQDDSLIVRYFITGKLWGAAIEGHAAGTLVPASPSPTGGVGGAGGSTGSGVPGVGGAGGQSSVH